MRAEMVYILFKEFLEDGLTTLNVDKSDWPAVKHGMAFIYRRQGSNYIN